MNLDELKLKVDHNTDYSQIFRDFLLDKYKSDVKLAKKFIEFDNKTKEMQELVERSMNDMLSSSSRYRKVHGFDGNSSRYDVDMLSGTNVELLSNMVRSNDSLPPVKEEHAHKMISTRKNSTMKLIHSSKAPSVTQKASTNDLG